VVLMKYLVRKSKRLPGGFKADKANDELDISYSNGKCMLDILDLSFLGKEYKKIISLLCYEM